MVNTVHIRRGRKLSKLATPTWADENEVGRARADELVERMVREENPLLLRNAVAGMSAAGPMGGENVGFLFRIAERLMDAGRT